MATPADSDTLAIIQAREGWRARTARQASPDPRIPGSPDDRNWDRTVETGSLRSLSVQRPKGVPLMFRAGPNGRRAHERGVKT